MKNNFQKFIITNKLFCKDDLLLVAVSGGIDSCVLLNLLYENNYNCLVAHCNFGLRGSDSENDELFVKNLAKNYNYKFVSKKFDTINFASQNSLSIQMSARDLRYNYFEEIRKKYNCKSILTAHHADDNIETIFINLLRGTGLKGLTGIPVKINFISRPLLFAFRNQINSYALKNKLQWREDSSNKANKYLRNKIRHKLVPLLEEISSSSKKTLLRNIENFTNENNYFSDKLKKDISRISKETTEQVIIDIEELKKNNFNKVILYEIISKYGFNPKQTNKIFDSLSNESGKMFYSSTHCLNKDRENLIITPLIENKKQEYLINKTCKKLSVPVNMNIYRQEWNKKSKIITDNNIAMLDADIIEFPLKIRHWKKGDYFYPLGKNNQKKLSDFFIDNKVPNSLKRKLWLIESGNKIVWICNYRIDNRFKITNSTKNIILLELLS